MPNSIITGPGSAAAIPEVVQRLYQGTSRVIRTVIVTSGGFHSRPWSTAIYKALDGLSIEWLEHRGPVCPASVALLAGQLRAARPDVVLAVGGGSVLDAAKSAVRLSGVRDLDAETVIAACTGSFQPPPVRTPLVAVPTTPGTGAEVTPFATVWQPEDNRKLSLADRDLAPAAVILDPDLASSLSGDQVCASLLDTLCQGAEAAWSVRSTAESTSYGLAAVALVGPFLGALDPEQPGESARLTLQIAGHLSGQAIALATTSSCHALSYPLTLRAGLTHGHACAVTFGRMLRYNADVSEADCADPRGPDRVRSVIDRIVVALGAADPDDAGKRVDAFLGDNNLATLPEVPCPADLLAREALEYSRIADNPRQLSHSSLVRQLEGASPGKDD
ncbi:MAG TPA: iron-containing alcohol dehydrogenase [Trebonia sp.]